MWHYSLNLFFIDLCLLYQNVGLYKIYLHSTPRGNVFFLLFIVYICSLYQVEGTKQLGRENNI